MIFETLQIKMYLILTLWSNKKKWELQDYSLIQIWSNLFYCIQVGSFKRFEMIKSFPDIITTNLKEFFEGTTIFNLYILLYLIFNNTIWKS